MIKQLQSCFSPAHDDGHQELRSTAISAKLRSERACTPGVIQTTPDKGELTVHLKMSR